MKIELINEPIRGLSLLSQVLYNRGIKDIEHYLHVSEDDIINPLEMNGMREGAKMLLSNVIADRNAYILVDCDADGFTSAATLLNYLHRLFPEYVDKHVQYFLHLGKQHGLNDTIDYLKEADFIIIPDAGSNDYDEIHELKELGKDILILDHHEAPKVSGEAVVINPQLDNYENKDLSGATVVWKFCSYLDTLSGQHIADDLLDLAVTGTISDMMDLRGYETHYLVQKGLSNVKNPFLLGMMDKNSYQLNGHLNPHGVSFFIAPLINSVNRVGTLEEKKLLFDSMLEYKAYLEVPSTKRGCKGQMETIVEQAIRTSSNVRSRQNRLRDAKFDAVMAQIEEEHLKDNKLIIVKQENISEDETGLTGLIANQVVGTLHRPVLLLRRTERNNEFMWEGSGRNAEGYGIDDLRGSLESTYLPNLVQGHASAFGFSISNQKLDEFIKATNELFADCDFSQRYKVDAIISAIKVDVNDIIGVARSEDLWGQNIEKPLLELTDIKVTSNNVLINEKVLKITINENLSIVKFKPTQIDFDIFDNLDKQITISVVGTCAFNSYDNTAQIMMTDYEVKPNKIIWDF